MHYPLVSSLASPHRTRNGLNIGVTTSVRTKKYSTPSAMPSSRLKRVPPIRSQRRTSSARVARYLLVELFNRRAILSDGPCASLVKQLEPESGDNSGLVFDIGEWHREYLLRLCTFDFFPMSFGISVSLQFGHPPSSTQHPPHTLRPPPSTLWRI